MNSRTLDLKWAKRGVLGSIIASLILTVLELPAPIGFETRPQSNVSHLWLILFFAILISEFTTIALVFKRPRLGATLGIVAATLNILQVIADQAHLMQPQVASFRYSILEVAVAIISIALIYFAWNILRAIQVSESTSE
jgi:hypothetical protein